MIRTDNHNTFTITDPVASTTLWAIFRAGLIADRPNMKNGRHQMVLTAKGRAAADRPRQQ